MGRPRVTVYVTASIDGRIASWRGDSRLSCPYDLRRLHAARAASDAVMVGANTVRIDDPLLTVRLVRGANPLRIIVDGALRSPLSSRVYSIEPWNTLVLASRSAPRNRVEALRNKGVEVVILEGDGRIDMSEALGLLYDRGVRSLLVEGGGELIWSLASQGLIDEMRVTWSPVILGGLKATPMVGGLGFEKVSEALRLRLVSASICECGDEIHAVYIRRG